MEAEPTDLERARRLLIEAKVVAERMSDAGPRHALVAKIAGAQAAAGDRQAALATAAGIGNSGWKAVAEGLADAGDVSAALDAAGKIATHSTQERMLLGNGGRDDALREIARRSARRGDFKGAVRAMDKIVHPMFLAGALADLGEAQASAGDTAAARRSFQVAALAAERSRLTVLGALARITAYEEIGKAQGRLGDRAAAIAAFDTALTAVPSLPKDNGRDNLLAAHASARAEAGDCDGARRALKAMGNPGQARRAEVTVVRCLTEAGLNDRASETAAGIFEDQTRADGFAAMGAVYARHGDAARAAAAFERAVEAAEKRPRNDGSGPFSFRDEALMGVVLAQALAGDRDGALRTADRMVLRNAATADYVNDAIYGRLATARAQAGDSEAALASVAQIRGFPPPPEMWRALGVTEGRRGNVDAVLPRGPAERDEERRAEFLMGLAEGLMARAGGARQP